MEELWVTQQELTDLGEYSCSMPTGTYIGKRWKRNLNAYNPCVEYDPDNPDWIIGEYYDIGSTTDIGIRWFKPMIRQRLKTAVELAQENQPHM